jgi:hypothetical protein
MYILLGFTVIVFISICIILGLSKIEFNKGTAIVLLSVALCFNVFYMRSINGYKNGQINELYKLFNEMEV